MIGDGCRGRDIAHASKLGSGRASLGIKVAERISGTMRDGDGGSGGGSLGVV